MPRTSAAVLASSTIESATSTAISARLGRVPPPCRGASARRPADTEAESEGTSPNSIVVRNDRPIVNASTVPSTPASASSGLRNGISDTNACTSSQEQYNPSVPPAAARIMDSERNCCTSRRLLAPSAMRTATSSCRSNDRASRNCAVFAHAISSTIATAPNSSKRNRPVSPTIAPCNGRTRIVSPMSCPVG